MASIIQPPVTFTSNAASDLLRSSSNGFSGIPLKALGRARLGMRRRDFSVTAKLRKVEKHEYPWPDDADPNVKGGVLSHLSYFKPLKEKPKPVQLDFEKPLIELEKKINDVRKMADETGLDFSNQINSLENKYYQALENLYKHLTPIQRVNIARHPNRPTFLDHVFSITDKFVELHGDREGYDDPAIVTGIGTIDGERYMFIGHQKGRNTKENIKRNFGMPTPHGYRKALRMMHYADHHQFPIITFVDTPGAFADLKSEELGQGEAIAHNLRTMFGLKVPIVSIVIGEGGSGGALAIACANKLLMLENAVFYVASPEACAAILWKSAKAAPKAAEKLRITATELYKLQIADGIIPEPLGGAHADPSWTSQQIKAAVVESMNELKKMKTEELLKHRMLKFRKIGGFQEGIPIDPERKRSMKKKEKPVDSKKEKPLVSKKKIPLKRKKNLKGEIEKLKQQILKAKESSTEVPEPVIDGMIVKLKREVIREHFEAAKSMGLSERVKKLREEISGTNSGDQNMQALLMEKIDQLKHDFNQGLSTAPNYTRLKYKLDILSDLSRIKFNKKFEEVLHRPDIKEKTEALQAEISRSGAATVEDVEPELKEKILKTKKEIEAEVANALGLNVLKPEKDISKLISVPEIKTKVEHLNEKISKKIEDVVSSTDLKNMIAALKFQVTKAGTSPDLASKNKIEALEQQIRMRLSEAVNSSELKEEHEELREILKATESSPGSGNGSVIGDNSGSTDSRVGVNVGGYA